MDASYHIENLANHCRICGIAFPRKCKDKKGKNDIVDLVMTCYNVDISGEDEQVYPEHICFKCLSRMRRIAAAKGTKYINPSVALFEWQPHTSNCEVCKHFYQSTKGGRPKKGRKNRGRPLGESTSETVASVRAVAGVSLVSAAVDLSRISASQVDYSHLVCPLCKQVVNGPLQLGCERFVCAECIVQLLHSHGPHTCCPSCDAPVTSEHFMRCPDVVTDLFGNLRVKCSRGCHFSVPLKQLESHEESCNPLVSPPPARSTMSDITLGDVLATPLDAPLCPDEQLACTRLVKRALQESENPSVLVLKTGGQVC